MGLDNGGVIVSLVAVHVFLEKSEEARRLGHVGCTACIDNRANEKPTAKRMTTKIPRNLVVMQLAHATRHVVIS